MIPLSSLLLHACSGGEGKGRATAGWLLIAYPLICASLHSATNGLPARNVGIEGDVSITLARGDFLARPLDDRTALILRIENVVKAGDGKFTYDFHYIGFEPGEFPLANYLIHPDGTPATEIGAATLRVRSMLPEDHDGVLNAYVPRPFPWFGGYRMFLALLAALWAAGLVAFVVAGRKKTVVLASASITPPSSFAERIRPLVEAAAAGQLKVDGQAELERLLTGYWREKLNLSEPRMAESLAQLKHHAEAGALLCALERWLHRPGGATREEIRALLEPYRDASATRTRGTTA